MKWLILTFTWAGQVRGRAVWDHAVPGAPSLSQCAGAVLAPVPVLSTTLRRLHDTSLRYETWQ